MAIMVSILCATYNQEDYIAQALDSFLMQEADFEFEILVHDDASTDGTSAIVREYERRFPDVVKPLYQTENQYSKGVKITPLIAARAQGKYVALCEGDDYWTDPLKLQKQVALMEGDSACSLCVHSSLKVTPEGASVGEVRPAKGDATFSSDEIVVENPGLFATSSMLFPAFYYSELPEYYFRCPVGDWPLILFLSSRGSVRYIDSPMSAYRTNAVNSWTLSMRDRWKQVEFYRGLSELLIAYSGSLGTRLSVTVQSKVDEYDFYVALGEWRFNDLKLPRYRRFYRALKWQSRAVITVRQHCPRIASYATRAKRSVDGLLGRRS